MRTGASLDVPAYSTLAEDLASHGYIVVGFDAPYRTGLVVFPDGRMIERTQENNVENYEGQPQAGCLNELLNVNTSAPIAFNIAVPNGYTLSFNGTQTVSNVLLDKVYTVSNTSWNSFVNSPSDIDMQSKAGFLISADLSTKIGFTIKRTTALSNSSANIIVSIYADPTKRYDSNNLNNIYTRIVTAN